ncbi:MAG: hypothetical protein NTY20_04420 [Candidatus Aenigmarchaeota archaeon]|nr:hypothetical protein [Candidatus Aenigmarchaeota archaeon]
MKYASMGSSLPGRFRCVCGNEHRIKSRVYIDLEGEEFPIGLGCELTEEKKKEILNQIEFYKTMQQISASNPC